MHPTRTRTKNNNTHKKRPMIIKYQKMFLIFALNTFLFHREECPERGEGNSKKRIMKNYNSRIIH